MAPGGSVTHWIQQLSDGDAAAAQPLLDRYFKRLVRLADRKLGKTPRSAADEEDVALSAFHSFCQRAAAGRFPQLHDRDNLWRLLAVITARKAIKLVRHERQKVRDYRRIADDATPPDPADSATAQSPIDQVAGREPRPDFAAQLGEECHRLLERLDPHLRQVALWKMEGCTNVEIAAKVKRSVPAVERWLVRIRKHWEREDGQ